MTIFKKILIPIFLFSLISILIYKSEFKFKNSKSDSPPSNYLEKETFIKPSVQVFCQSCHNFVSPSEFSKESWPFIITQMYRLSGSLDSPPGFNRRQDLFDMYKNSPWKKPTEFHPDINKVIKYYQDNAPTIKDIMDNFHKKSFEIKNTNFKKTMAFRINTNENPTASEIKLIENSIFKPGTKGKGLIVSDLMNGGVHYFSLDYKTQILIGKVKHPTHFEIVDINNDQLMDFIVSDLGVLQTTDTNLGGVYAFINKGEAKFKKIKILGNLGRTAHVKTNITKSGQLNLLISCFGMYSSGGLYLLENLSLKKDKFSFKKIILDKRQGAIKGYFLDINKDGRDDLLTVLSQHYEQVVSYIQQKNGSYKALTLSKADSPTFGSSGLHLTDIDNDNDMDILWINGDVMDNFQVKNNQGIYLLENLGNLKFKKSYIADFPGIHDLKSADLDLDGDLDLVAVSALNILGEVLAPKNNVSIAWLENIGNNKFKINPLEINNNIYISVDLRDFNGDGSVDILVGNTYMANPKKDKDSNVLWVKTFLNKIKP